MNRKVVVLIHGIGEQYPMDTLRKFVENTHQNNKGKIYSRPERIRDGFETRRLSFYGTQKVIDYYEFYWADLVKPPKFSEIFFWAIKLIFFRSSASLYRRSVFISLRMFFGFIFLIIILLLIIGFLLKNETLVNLDFVIVTGFFLFVIVNLFIPFVKNLFRDTVIYYLGDAFMYTTPSPGNIGVRMRIRERGIDLLNKIHSYGNSNRGIKYDEIVLVGHSLGSLIGYDLLTFLFPDYHYNCEYKNASRDKIKEFVQCAASEQLKSQSYHSYQRTLSLQLAKAEWRITKFITLGSPMTYAPVLMARNVNELAKKINDRELPSCPPHYDENDEYRFFYIRDGGELVPHHAAHFALTRWTNIYFHKDWIGGEISSLFGLGIRDEKIKSNQSIRNLIPLLSHTKYWSSDEPEICQKINGLIMDS